MAHPHPHPVPAPSTSKPGKYVFAFGDSLTTTIFPGSPKRLPLDKPALLPGETSTGGSNWLEILADPGLSLPPPGGVGVWNFAVDDAQITAKGEQTCHSLAGQVAKFKDASGPAGWSEKDESAFIAWMGTDELLADAKSDKKADAEAKVKEYFGHLGELVKLGAGKMVVLSVPRKSTLTLFYSRPMDFSSASFKALDVTPLPDSMTLRDQFKHADQYATALDRTPFAKSKASLASTLKECVSNFNDALEKHAAAFKKAHPGVKLEIVDTVPVVNKVLDGPGEDLWHDEVHPGVKVHQSVAGKVRGVLGTVGFY
ncbi:MAG: hypothetical protein M1831_000506 [Alyxoria varia]|nr:MAG: hypothetical protein M1831_000506 [Alyxoria varia]